MPTGKVKWFNVVKGFGFIIPDEGGAEVYLSLRKVEEANLPRLETGLALRYTIGEERGRKFAEHLSVAEKPRPAVAKPQVPMADPAALDAFEREWGLRRQ